MTFVHDNGRVRYNDNVKWYKCIPTKCQTPSSKRRTDRQKKRRVSSSVRPFVRSFVSLSVVSVRGVRPMGENERRCFIEILRGG